MDISSDADLSEADLNELDGSDDDAAPAAVADDAADRSDANSDINLGDEFGSMSDDEGEIISFSLHLAATPTPT